MRYGSLCSGIEAASVAWEPLGWQPAWFAEIEPFPCAVLNHHWPHVPNHVLPTSRTARFSSPLGTYDFQKRSSLIQVSEQGAQKLGKIASVLAHGESLTAHARSAELRLKD